MFFACLALLAFILPPAARGQEYEIGEGDLLKITVYDNPDLANDVRVSGEGKITGLFAKLAHGARKAPAAG